MHFHLHTGSPYVQDSGEAAMLRLVCGRVQSLTAAAARASAWLPAEPLPAGPCAEVQALLAFMHVSCFSR